MQTSRNLITLPPIVGILFNEFSDDDSRLESRIESLKDELLDIQERVNEIQSLADSEGREFSAVEAREVESLFAQFEKTEQEIERREKILNQAKKLGQSRGRRSKPEDPGVQNFDGRNMPARGKRSNQPGESVAMFKNLQTGETVRGYRGTAPMAPENSAPVGDALRAILLKDFSGLPGDLRAALSSGSDTGGGYLATPTLSQRVIDLARANSVVMRAGATTVPMGGSELAIARITGDPSVAWRPETGAVTASKPTFGKYVLRPKTCAAIVPVSLELLEDTANAGQLIEQSLMAALGVEVDRVILEGTGASSEPLGIVNNTGVNSQTSVGTPSTYGQITTAITNILAANYPGDVANLAWVMNPVVGGVYDGLTTGISGDNTPLEPTPWVRQLMRHYTTNLAATGSPQNYNMVVGDFSECLVGMRTSGVVIDVLDTGQVTDEDSEIWNAATQFMRFIRARVRVDSLLMRPDWFSVLSGVQA